MTGVGTERICPVPSSSWWKTCTCLPSASVMAAFTAFPASSFWRFASLNCSNRLLGKYRIKKDVRFPCFGSDQCEACAPLYDIPSFIRDMDRQYRRTVAVTHLLQHRLRQVADHFAGQPEFFEDAVRYFFLLEFVLIVHNPLGISSLLGVK